MSSIMPLSAAARAIGASRNTVYGWYVRGWLQAERAGGVLLVRVEDVRRVAAGRKKQRRRRR